MSANVPTRTARKRVSDLVYGQPLPTAAMMHQLVHGGYAEKGLVLGQYLIPIAVCISLLVIIVTMSYSQTIRAYPKGGGAYRVAKEMFGERAALTAGAALITDYILTVSVSSSAATAALVSFFPNLDPWRIEITVAMIAIIAIINLRGVKESGQILAIPTYFFLGIMALTITVGMFKHPQPKNTIKTMVIMVSILLVLFWSVNILSLSIHAAPSHIHTVISQIGQAVWGEGSLLLGLLLLGSFLILSMASNTAFADFPRLAALIADDQFHPRSLSERGPRLALDLGIVMLAVISSILVIITGAIVTRLIPLYMVGVFLAFTISQSGMVKRL